MRESSSSSSSSSERIPQKKKSFDRSKQVSFRSLVSLSVDLKGLASGTHAQRERERERERERRS